MDWEGKEPPTLELLEAELEKELDRCDRIRLLKNTIFWLLMVAAAAALAAVLFFPFLQINGTSMERTLYNGDLVVAVASSRYQEGDVIAFNYNNSILVKRVIALPGEKVEIDGDGNVYVDGQPLEEPYVYEKDLGRCNINFPYWVPEGEVFVLGDHRSVSVDSRNTAVGCVKEEAVVGEVLFRIWPIQKIGRVD